VTATLSSRGQIVIPQEVRDRCGLREGDHFVVEDNPDTQVVVLRKIKEKNYWFQVYMECPASFEIPPRRRQFYRKKWPG
jgi:AbrB family looped-hinge helix DNA binding protein